MAVKGLMFVLGSNASSWVLRPSHCAGWSRNEEEEEEAEEELVSGF